MGRSVAWLGQVRRRDRLCHPKLERGEGNSSRCSAGTVLPEETQLLDHLILLTPLLLTEALTRKGGLGTTPLTGLHEVTVLLDFLDDVFRLHFPLEAPESVL